MGIYGPGLAVDAVTIRPVAHKALTATTLDGQAVQLRDAAGAVFTPTTNAAGIWPQFRADADVLILSAGSWSQAYPSLTTVDDATAAALKGVAELLGTEPTTEATTTTALNLWPNPHPTGGWSTTRTTATYSGGVMTITDTGGADGDAVYSTSRPAIPADVSRVWFTAKLASTQVTGMYVVMQVLQGGNTLVTHPAVEVPVTAGGSVARVPFDVPAGGDNFRVFLSFVGKATAGHAVTVTDIGVLTADVPYFDGGIAADRDGSDGRTAEYAWTGAVEGSASSATITTTTITGGAGWPKGETVASRINSTAARVEALESAGAGRAPVGAPVPAPPGWGLRLMATPTVTATGRDTYAVSLSEAQLAAAYRPSGTPVWVSPSGSAGAPGSSRTAPTTLASALSAGAPVIYLTAGEYRTDTATTAYTSHSYALVAVDPGVYVTGYLPAPTWTKSGSVYTAPVVASGVVDPRAAYDTAGVHRTYVKAASAAAVTGPGMWYADASTTTVWPLGDTDLTAAPDTLRLVGKTRTGLYSSAGNVWCEGIAFEGLYGCGKFGGVIVSVDCSYRYSSVDNGLNVRNALAISIRCDASGNWLDGFNYHEDSGKQCDFIEIDCTGTRNGQASKMGNCNATTAHESVRGLRVGGVYSDSYGPVVADVNAARTLTVGGSVGRSAADMGTYPYAQVDGAVAANAAAGGAGMWLHGVGIVGGGPGATYVATTGPAEMHLRADRARAATVSAAAGTTIDRMGW